MNAAEKDKLKHDTMNSIVIINSMTKSATSLLQKLSECMDCHDPNNKQIEKLLYAMNAILSQTAKIDTYFQHTLNE